jgi:GR25 family glycosyltransferase involved in LPS biosynthesis
MITDKIYCLHHPPLIKRKEAILQSFEKLHMNVEWVENFSPQEIETIPEGCKSKGQVSLYLKHKYCLHEQLKNKYNRILVFEDDCLIPINFEPFYHKCIEEFDALNGDIMFLGVCCQLDVINPIPNKCVYYDPSYKSRCTHCYVITLSCTEKIIKLIDENIIPMDFKYNECIEKTKVKSCYTYPAVYQGTESGLYWTSLYVM